MIGIDIEKNRGFSGDSFLVGDMRKLPVKARKMDMVVLNHSLEHVENFEECLNEVGRVCKGQLYISVPDGKSLDDRLFRILGRITKGRSSHVNIFSSIQLVKCVEEVGFKLVEKGEIKSGFTYLPKIVSGVFVKVASFTDRLFSSKTSIYGWEFVFRKVAQR